MDQLKTDEEVSQYLEELGLQYRYHCYKEKNPEVCHLLGMYFATIKRDEEKAIKVYKVNCDTYDWKQSCYRYGYLLNKKNENKDSFNTEAVNYFLKGCPEVSKSCYMAGIKYGKHAENSEDNKTQKEYYAKAVKYLDMACDNKLGVACFNLSTMYFKGIPAAGIKKDMQKMLDYSLKGCEYKYVNSCLNLSVIYSKGEGGIEKNLELAKKYKEEAKELFSQMTGSYGGIKFEQGTE